MEHPGPLIALRARHGMSCPFSGEQPGVSSYNEYDVIAKKDADLDGELIGLNVTTSGRFGNALIGCPNGIAIALQKGLRYLRLPDVEGLQVESPFVIGDLTILPTHGPLPEGGCFLRGPFDDFSYFPSLVRPDRDTVYLYHQTYIRPLLGRLTRSPDSELAIHIRSGDIFSTYVHGHYVQPPLSFYKTVVQDLAERQLIDRVRLVFEDRLNPCVDALERWLHETDMPTRTQSSSFYSDLVSMIDSNHFCFGFGSLGPAVCLLSKRIHTVHLFQSRRERVGADFQSASEINEYVLTKDYISLGSWINSREQRELMLSFPDDGIYCHRSVK